jgi:hypothetical protein
MFSAKQDSGKLVGLKVYVKYNLIFLNGPPKVYPGKIVFTKDKNLCGQPLWDTVIGKGAQVEIIKVSKNSRFVRVVIKASELDSFEILLAKSMWGRFEKSFHEVFSLKAVEESPGQCEPKTEQELIKCYGYPIYKCDKDGKKIFYYNEGFVGSRIHSFHDIWFEIKKGIVVGEYGYI